LFANKLGVKPESSRQKRIGGFKAVFVKTAMSLLLAGLLTTTGCTNIEPWIKPYERQNLADPIMSQSRHGIANSYMHHVYQSREGARGAEGGSGGGCGCN
jgi:hypothetical protein